MKPPFQMKQLFSRLLVFSIFFSFGLKAYSQITYVSANNYSGDWNDVPTWSFLPASETWAPATPGNPTNSNCDAINLYGYIRIEGGGLTINNSNPLVTVYDTLYIIGNVSLGSGADMRVETTGILIIDGNLTLEGSFDMVNGGNVVVTGNLNVTNGTITNNTDFYVFGSTSVSGGGTLNGCDGYGNPGGCTPAAAGNIGDETDLENDNPVLSDFVDNDGTTLPITLLYFSADQADDLNKLKWATAFESNFYQFEVERAGKDLVFEKIAVIQGAGESRSVLKYSFEDQNPLKGLNYYRLKSVDFDGTYSYSPLVRASSKLLGKIVVYPNPAQAGNGLVMDTNQKESAVVTLFGANGAQIMICRLEEGNGLIQLPNNLHRGIYYLKASTPSATYTERLIIE